MTARNPHRHRRQRARPTEQQQRVFEYKDHWLWKRDDCGGRWYIYWYKAHRRHIERKSTRTTDLDKAKDILIEFADRRARPGKARPDEVPIMRPLDGYVAVHLAGTTCQGKALGTARLFAEFFGSDGITTVADLTYDAQERFIEWRREQLRSSGIASPSNGTIQRDLATLRAALNWYAKRGLLSEAPYVRSVPTPPPRDRFLTENEVTRLLAECREPHLRLFVLLALHTVQRPGAILGLHREQVHLGSGYIDFLPPGNTQTRKRRPIVPITATLRPHLIEAIAESMTGFVIEYLGKPVNSVKTAFNKAAGRAGLTDVSPYTLRHTGATLMAKEGVPIWQISGMLGHTNERTSQLYAKHSPEFLGEAASALDRLFGESKAQQRLEPPRRLLPAPCAPDARRSA